MIDEKGLTTEKRTVYFAALLVENMRRRFKVSDDNMDELAAGALQVLLAADAGNKAMGALTTECTGRLWRVIAAINDARDGRTEH